MFTVDAHLDLATNAITLNRDLTKPVHFIREKERKLGWNDTQDRGNGTVALPELRKGNVGLVVATIISRFSTGAPLASLNLPGWHSPEGRNKINRIAAITVSANGSTLRFDRTISI